MKLLIILCCAFVVISTDDRDSIFFKLGSYAGKNAAGDAISKNYYAPNNLKGTWIDGRLFCKTNQMDLVRFESQAEHDAVRVFLKANKNRFTEYVHVDGVTSTQLNRMHNKVDWFYEDGKKIPYAIEWGPSEPNGVTEKCLTLYRDGNFKISDYSCDLDNNSFICQETFF